MQCDLIENMIDPCSIGQRRPAYDAVYLISLFQKKFRQIGAVLPRYTGYKRFFHLNTRSFLSIILSINILFLYL